MNPLIWSYLDDTLSEEEFSSLQEWLREDPTHVAALVQQASVDRQLREVLREGAAAKNILVELAENSAGTDRELAGSLLMEQTLGGGQTQVASRPQHWKMGILVGALAASLITVIFLTSGMLRWPDDAAGQLAKNDDIEATTPEELLAQNKQQDEENLMAALPVAATVTGVLDVDWADPTKTAEYGELLQEGRVLSLKDGLIQLTFDSGAKLLVQGPADFVVRSEMRGTLDAGKISAVVPRRAHGFTVRTPSAEVIDLGTEFAIQVDELGSSEVHVFDGEVLAQALSQDGELVGDLVHVTEQKAVKYTSDSPVVSTINYNDSKFRRELEPRLADDELPALPVRRELALWLAADQTVKLDDKQRVVAWGDILTGDNQSAEDALQHIPEIRPLWVEEGVSGRPALRFNGTSHLVTTPLETTDDQTVSLVFSINHRALSRSDNGGQLLSYNGPPQREITNISQPGVLQLGDYWGDKKMSGVFTGFVYSVNKGQGVKSGLVSGYKLKPNRTVVMTYVYDRSAKKAKMFINGRIQGTSTASSLPAITSRKVIGRHGKHFHHFIGDLCEVLIFNTALKHQERVGLDRYLMERYGLSPDDQPDI